MDSFISAGLPRRLADSLFSAFFPDNCRLCDLPLTGWTRTPVCEACWRDVRAGGPEHACVRCGAATASADALDADGQCAPCGIAPPAYDRAVTFARYEGGLRRLIHLLKYDRMQPLAAPLGDRLAGLSSRIGDADLVVAAPLHWRRGRERGFNQAHLLAAHAAKAWDLPLASQALERTKVTTPQAGLSRAARLANVRGAFRVRDRRAVDGRRVVLIDDVMTTGATLDACARVLKRAGANTVTAVTLARAIPEGRVSG